MTGIDFGRHAGDYAAWRPGFPSSFYQRLDGLLPINGCRVVDLACGPGTMALELAERGASVVGVDIAAGQVAMAKELAGQRGLSDRAQFRVAAAERTGLAETAFDLVTAGQCWHWFDAPAALEEVARLLRPNGLLVIAQYSYLAELSPVARETEALILQFNPGWTFAGSNGVDAHQIDVLIGGGFRFVEAFCYDQEEVFSHARWRGRMRTCNGVGSGGLAPPEVERFDEALQRRLRQRYPEPLIVPHRVWCVVGRKPA